MAGVGLLLILGALQGLQSHSIQVYQIPRVDAVSGSSVTLECQYTLSNISEGDLGWFTWYRHLLNGDCVSNTEGLYKGRVSKSSQSDFINKRSANIILHNVDLSDTGMYICQVTFQLNETISGHGSGTFLNVTDETDDKGMKNIIQLSTASGVLTVGILVIFCLWRAKASDPVGQESPIISTDLNTQVEGSNSVERQATEDTMFYACSKDSQWQSTSVSPYNLENQQYSSCEQKERVEFNQMSPETPLYSEIP
ncbi:natural cytotoxicity triggering receptor 3-like [Pelobates cultripes]|uniref:Natural cytotoxicity triggering receptor 3 n=1 Tax=Pelobates cultripes TaxID=61616 RepID=A0AAD1WGS1_PELCU|nr:natural cytotoxicity triggering receptor 3-like [Pelobates cultripes]